MDFYVIGVAAAAEKYAADFKSPKMRELLNGAYEGAFTAGAQPRYTRRSELTYWPQPWTEKTRPIRELLDDQRAAGQAAKWKRIEEIRSGLREPNTTPRELATPIGRPRENAIRAILNRPFSREPLGPKGLGYARMLDPGKYPASYHEGGWPGTPRYTPTRQFAHFLNELHGARMHNNYETLLGNPAYRALLQKHTPDLLQRLAAGSP